MADPFDVYSDYFFVHCNYWVTTFLFGRSDVASTEGETTRLGTVTMTNTDAKMMIYLAWQQVMEQEQNSGTPFEVPAEVLERMGWSRDYWDAFWAPMEDPE